MTLPTADIEMKSPAQWKRDSSRLYFAAAAGLLAAAGVSTIVHFTLYEVTIMEGLVVASIFYFFMGTCNGPLPSMLKSAPSAKTGDEDISMQRARLPRKLNLARALRASDYADPIADINDEELDPQSLSSRPTQSPALAITE